MLVIWFCRTYAERGNVWQPSIDYIREIYVRIFVTYCDLIISEPALWQIKTKSELDVADSVMDGVVETMGEAGEVKFH